MSGLSGFYIVPRLLGLDNVGVVRVARLLLSEDWILLGTSEN